MVVTKPAEIRKEQKKYFSIAYKGEPVVVSRPRNENVVVISEEQYKELTTQNRLLAYYSGLMGKENLGGDLSKPKARIIGIAKGKLKAPDNLDEYNDEIAGMFGV